MVICRAAVPDIEREASAELADDFGMDEQMSPLAGRQNIEFTNRQLVSLILPMLAEQLLGITVGLADSLMVATVGDASISAVSLVDSVSALMIYIFSAMATGGAVVAGQYLGRREREEACRSALTAASQLFAAASRTVAQRLGFLYPDYERKVTAYVRRMWEEARRAGNDTEEGDC